MPRRIVLLSDGTGNSSAKVWRTNVWRMFNALDLTNDIRLPAMTMASARHHSNL